jgi:hypothetical protein
MSDDDGERWSVPTIANRVRSRNKIDRNTTFASQDDAYSKADRPKRRNSVDYARVAAAMRLIDIEVMPLTRRERVKSDVFRLS